MVSENKTRITYFFDQEIGDQYYGEGHPMKPHRVRLTHELVMSYGLFKKMNIYKPLPLSEKEMSKFHRADYVSFLKNVNMENKKEYELECQKYLGKISDDSDCPIFDGLFRFCQMTAGASVGAADHLIFDNADVAVNWGGGLHHAKKIQATGFCYINDIVLAIVRLLERYPRVLYVDIDVHHGDGVEEAFYTTDRVMTLSFHKGGNFYPGTGKIDDVGDLQGKHYAVNFPLQEGVDDQTFQSIFKPTLERVMQSYRPDAIVLQCGADSLTRDRLGVFNMTLKGHGECVKTVLGYRMPTLVLGGGGYTVKNVARCWTYETSIIADTPLPNDLPYNDNYEKYGPDYQLHIDPSEMENYNTPTYLNNTMQSVFENLRQLPCAPSVQMSHNESMEDGPMEDALNDDALEEDSEGEVKREKLVSLEVNEGEFFEEGESGGSGAVLEEGKGE